MHDRLAYCRPLGASLGYDVGDYLTMFAILRRTSVFLGFLVGMGSPLSPLLPRARGGGMLTCPFTGIVRHLYLLLGFPTALASATWCAP